MIKKIKYLALITFLIIVGICIWRLYTFSLIKTDSDANITAQIVDGNTNKPVRYKEILVCLWTDIDYGSDGPDRTCDGKNRKIIKQYKTDISGKFSFSTKDSIFGSEIFIELAKPYGLLNFSVIDGSVVRVLRQESPGDVISNQYYNIKTRTVKEVFTDGSPEKNNHFDTIQISTHKQ